MWNISIKILIVNIGEIWNFRTLHQTKQNSVQFYNKDIIFVLKNLTTPIPLHVVFLRFYFFKNCFFVSHIDKPLGGYQVNIVYDFQTPSGHMYIYTTQGRSQIFGGQEQSLTLTLSGIVTLRGPVVYSRGKTLKSEVFRTQILLSEVS